MKEIVVISGKGGTGKSSITAALAYVSDTKTVLADCDVDASDLHLLLKPEQRNSKAFFSSEIAIIHQDKCTQCGLCEQVCRFDAINFEKGQYQIDSIACEGCGYCAHICPESAITMDIQQDGMLYISQTRLGKRLFHAELRPGAENSGKLVASVKNSAKHYAQQKQMEYILADGSPGIGCPVISSLSGANLALFVTEPSQSGFHDLQRVIALASRFRLKMAAIINKSDLYPALSESISHFLETKKIPLLACLPYTEDFSKAMIQEKTVAELNPDYFQTFENIWHQIKTIIGERK
jgi:MinD superfamily P-loop ATPase